MKVLTVATHSDGQLPLLETLSPTLGYDLRVLGRDQQWKGLDWKLELYLEVLKSLPDDEIVMCVDGYDVVIIEEAEKIKEKFLALGKPFVCSAQRVYASHPFVQSLADKLMANDIEFDNRTYPQVYSPYKRPCTGAMIGRALELHSIFQELVKCNHDRVGNDQILMTRFYLKNPERVFLDSRCDIFQNLWKSKGILLGSVSSKDNKCEVELDLSTKNSPGIINKYFKTRPGLLHGPYNLNMNPLLKELGFDPCPISQTKHLNYLRYSIFHYIGRFFKLYGKKLALWTGGLGLALGLLWSTT